MRSYKKLQEGERRLQIYIYVFVLPAPNFMTGPAGVFALLFADPVLLAPKINGTGVYLLLLPRCLPEGRNTASTYLTERSENTETQQK